MGKNKEKEPITPESVLAAVKEMLAVSSEEFDRRLKKSQEEHAKRNEEFEQIRKKSQEEHAKRNEEFEQIRKKSQEEQAKRSAELDLQLKQLTQQVSGISKSNGLFAEDFFLSSFKRDDLNFFGEQFDKVIRGKGTIVQDEYDFVLINGKTTGIVEVKYRARNDDIEQALKKVDTFRINFPEYRHHKIYLAIAALSIDERLERECLKQGIAVIKEVGDKIVVYDKNLKAF